MPGIWSQFFYSYDDASLAVNFSIVAFRSAKVCFNFEARTTLFENQSPTRFVCTRARKKYMVSFCDNWQCPDSLVKTEAIQITQTFQYP